MNINAVHNFYVVELMQLTNELNAEIYANSDWTDELTFDIFFYEFCHTREVSVTQLPIETVVTLGGYLFL